VRNLSWLRKLSIDNVPGFGARLHEMFNDVINGVGVLEQQTNGNCSSHPTAPPPLQGMTVQPHEHGFDVSIQHEGEFYRGVRYYVSYADNPHFAGARTFPMHDSRNAVLPLGSRTLYFQAHAAYAWSGPTAPVFHGGSVPVAVTGGTGAPVALLPSQGCGTTRAGEPPAGPGVAAFRSSNGAPPVRSAK
jgi:hypothetical protein